MNPYIFWPFLGGIVCLAVALYLITDLTRKNRGNTSMVEYSRSIRDGSRAFLKQENIVAGVLILAVFLLIGFAHEFRPRAHLGWSVGLAYLLGALLTALAGIIGMATAVRTNSRTAEAARLGGMSSALGVAIGGGAVMGLCTVGFSLIGLSIVLFFFRHTDLHIYAYALGVSVSAMFIRLSGGIYTKGADIGADYVTRSEPGFTENDVRNAAIIADNVGDNIGNVAGVGANLMESYVEAIIAVMAIALTLRPRGIETHPGLVMLPLLIGTVGALASVLGIFAVRMFVRNNPQRGLMLAALLSAGITLSVSWLLVDRLAESFSSEWHPGEIAKQGIFIALALGFAAGGLISLFSEYYTSFRFRPTRAIAQRSQFGTALAVLEGFSAGMKSAGILTLIVAATVTLAYHQAEFYGITMAAFGMLSIVGMVVTLNAFGPIVDNAGGIAEMSRMDRSVRNIMENLHGVSDVTTAMGKGFANGSAALVSLGLLIAFIKASGLKSPAITFDHPAMLEGLLVGAMFPLYLSSLLIRAVGSSASEMIEEVRRQLREIPGLREGKTRPDYARCAELATRKAVRGMIGPGMLIVAAPIVIGLLLGKATLFGFLAGSLVCSLAQGFQMVNAGGAMNNAKKYIEEGYFGGKGSEAHRAAMAGDAVGDALKDTVGPVMAMMSKLMCVVALLLVPLL